jgi:hypothetical protein
MTFTGMLLEKGMTEGVEQNGIELSMNFARLFVLTIS